MPRNQPGIHYALVDESARLMRIIELLKEADHPLSAQEIGVQAYDFTVSGMIMLNVSTNIGEIRGMDNLDAGYVVSEATRFRPPKDEAPRYPWHDGRPRYWLIAAPGWMPRWRVVDGRLETVGQGHLDRVDRITADEDEKQYQGVLHCQNPQCDRELPEGHEGPPFCPGPNDACRKAFFESLQGSLF
jgi:hypothetical protein